MFHTWPHCESRAVEVLADRGLTTYIPRLRAEPRRQAALVLPSYVFVCGDLAAAGIAPPHYLPKLGEIVAFNRREPVVVPQSVIAWLQAQERDATRGALHSDEQAGNTASLTNLQTALQAAASSEEQVHILLQCPSPANEIEILGSAASGDVAADVKRSHRRSTRGGGRKIHYR